MHGLDLAVADGQAVKREQGHRVRFRREPAVRLASEVGGDHVGLAQHVGGDAVGDAPAEIQHGDAVGDLGHERHVVVDDQDRQAFGGDPLRAGRAGRFLGRVQAGGRLVEQQQLGLPASARAISISR